MRQHVQKQTSVCQKGWQAKPRNQARMSGIHRVPNVHRHMNSESKNGRVMKVQKWKQDDKQFYQKTTKLCAREKSASMSVPIARYHVTYHVIPSHRSQKWKFCFTSRSDFRQVQLTSSIPRQLPIMTLAFKTLKDSEALKTKPTRCGTCLEGLPVSWAQLRSHGWLHALWLSFPRSREDKQINAAKSTIWNQSDSQVMIKLTVSLFGRELRSLQQTPLKVLAADTLDDRPKSIESQWMQDSKKPHVSWVMTHVWLCDMDQPETTTDRTDCT